MRCQWNAGFQVILAFGRLHLGTCKVLLHSVLSPDRVLEFCVIRVLEIVQS